MVVKGSVMGKAANSAQHGNSRRSSANRRLARLMAGASCSAAALALALAPGQSRAQAVNGTPTVVFGSDPASNNPGTTSFNITAQDVLIDWTSTNATFLPSGNTLSFNSDSNSPFTVLNRITSATTTGALTIDGAMSSTIGGKVWFYNPNGWIVGSNARISVASLMLTASPVIFDSTQPDGSKFGTGGTITLGATPNPSASITTQTGSLIALSRNNSYLALVAPKIVHQGNANVNGSIAYVAAEAATLTINNGLFDITVDSGTSDTQGIFHSGTTTGSASSASSPNHGIYMVAVPKNQAMTMLVTGNVGYAAANTVIGETDGTITLASGYNVAGGAVDYAAPASTQGSIIAGALRASNNLDAYAALQIGLAENGTSSAYAANASFSAQKGIIAIFGPATANATVTSFNVGGNLTLRAGNGATGAGVGIIARNLDRGTITVGNDLVIDTSATGTVQTAPGSVGEDAVAGDIVIGLNNAVLGVRHAMTLNASAISGVGTQSAGNATGGNISMGSAGTGGYSLSPLDGNDTLQITTAGVSGALLVPPSSLPVSTGDAASGNVLLNITSSGFAADNIQITNLAATTAGTDGVVAAANGGNTTITFAAPVSATYQFDALTATNGVRADGGTVTPGNLAMSVTGGPLTVNGAAGNPNGIALGSTVRGSPTTTGSVGLSVSAAGSILSSSAITLLSSATNGAPGKVNVAPTINLTADGGLISSTGVNLFSLATGTALASDATGGDINVTVDNFGQILTGTGNFGIGTAGTGASGTDGGRGKGGNVLIDVGAGTIATSSGSLTVIANGIAGKRAAETGASGSGEGGSITLALRHANSSISSSAISLLAEGRANGAQAGTGTSAQGGTIDVTMDDGNIASNTLSLSAQAIGGAGSHTGGAAGGDGGAATGGSATFTLNGGFASTENFDATSNARGGAGADYVAGVGAAGNGGAGTGGSTNFAINGGAFSAGSITLSANANAIPAGSPSGTQVAFGGAVSADGGTAGTGGSGTGGTAGFTQTGGTLIASKVTGSLSVVASASGSGGDGGDAQASTATAAMARGAGGAGVGGTATYTYGGGTSGATQVALFAAGSGGQGGTDNPSDLLRTAAGAGGSGQGGTVVASFDADFNPTHLFQLDASGTGANGASGLTGGQGGAGQGGSATFNLAGTSSLASLQMTAAGTGGAGGDSAFANAGAAGGAGIGGDASILVGVRPVSGTATATVSGFTVSAKGTGGAGGAGGDGTDFTTSTDSAGDGGAGGAATGGTVTVAAGGTGNTLSLVSSSRVTDLDAGALGGRGGLGGNSVNFGFNTGGNGGTGGSAAGGTLVFSGGAGASLALGDASFAVDALGGAGGGLTSSLDAPDPRSNGGAGGSATGGTIRVESDTAGSQVSAGILALTANGTGGAGADGSGNDPVSGLGGNGGAGAMGTGGTVRLDAGGGGAVSFTGLTINASGTGGDGGRGFDGVSLSSGGGNGGDGGDGGMADGGSASLLASNGGTISGGAAITTQIFVNGQGGQGGNGGDGGSAFVAGNGGNGGNGGNNLFADGGTADIAASGGSIALGNVSMFANGLNSDGGAGGPGGTGAGTGSTGGTSGFFGFTDFGQGGTLQMSASPGFGGVPGSLVLGNVSAEATAYSLGSTLIPHFGGRVVLTDTTDDTTGAFRLSSLDINAIGLPPGLPSVAITSSDQPIRISGNFIVDAAGGVSIQANDDTGGLTVGGLAQVFAGDLVSVTANGGVNVLDVTGNALIFTGGAFRASSTGCATAPCTAVRAGGFLDIGAADNVDLLGPAWLQATGLLSVTAGQDVTGEAGSGYLSAGNLEVYGARDAQIRNASGSNVSLFAGTVPGDSGNTYDQGQLLVGGTGTAITATAGSANLTSGGTVRVLPGSSISAGSGISASSGDDILIGSGSTLTANTAGNPSPGNVTLAAGSITPATPLAAGNIRSLIVSPGATVNAGTGAIALSGNAIVTTGATFSGASFTADVFGVPALGAAQSNDGGQLVAGCLQGDICLGAVTTTGAITVGQGSETPLHLAAASNLSGSAITLSSRGNMAIGTVGGPVTLSSPGTIRLRSIQGDVALLGSSQLTGGTLAITAGGSLTGNGVLRATANDVGITVGGSSSAGSITARRFLTSAALAGTAGPFGTYTVPGSFSTTALVTGGSVDLSATSITIGSASTGGGNLRLTASGALSLDTTSNVANLTLAGNSIAFGSIGGSGNVSLTATNSATGTAINAGGALAITANSLTVPTLVSGGDTVLTITQTANLGTVDAGGSITIDPVDLNFTAMTAAGAISLTAGNVSGGTLDAGTSLDIAASGNVVLDSAQAGTSLTIDAASLTVPVLASGGDTTLTVGGAAALGTVDSAAAISLTADTASFSALAAKGAISLSGRNATGGTIDAGTTLDVFGTGTFTADSTRSAGATTITNGAGVQVASLTSGGGLVLNGNAGASLDSASVTGNTAIDVVDLTFGSLAGTGLVDIVAASVTGTSLTAGNGLHIGSTGPIALGTTTVTGDAVVNFGPLDVGAFSTTGATTITAASITGGTFTAGTGLTLNSSGAIDIASARAGTTLSLAGASLAAPVLQSGLGTSLSIGGPAKLGTVAAGTTLTGSTGALSFTRLSSGGATNLSVLGSMTGGDVTSGGNLDLFVTGLLQGGAVTSGGAIAITNGGGVDLANLAAASNLSLTSNGAVTLGTGSAGTGSLAIGADSLAFTSLTSGTSTSLGGRVVTGGSVTAGTALTTDLTGSLVLTSARAASMNIKARSIDIATLIAGGNAVLSSGGLVNLGTAQAGDLLDITAGTLAVTSASTTRGGIRVAADDVNAGTVDAATTLALTATGNAVVGSARSGGAMTISAANLSAPNLDSGGNMKLTVSGIADLGTVTSGGNVDIDPTDTTFTAIVSAGSTTITSGNVTGGTIDAGTSIAINATGDVKLTSATAGTGIGVAAASLDTGAVQAGQSASFDISGQARFTTLTAGTDLLVRSGATSFGAMAAGGNIALTGGGIAGGTLDAGGRIDLTSSGDITLASAKAVSGIAASAASMTAPLIQSGGDAFLDIAGPATFGGVTAAGDIGIHSSDLRFDTVSAGGILGLDGGQMNGGSAVAGTELDLSFSGPAVLGTGTAGTVLDATVGGSLSFTSLTAAGNATLTAASIAGGNLTSSAGGLSISTTGAAAFGSVRSALDASVTVGSLTYSGFNAGRSATIRTGTLNASAITVGQDLFLTSTGGVLLPNVNVGRNAVISVANGGFVSAGNFAVGGTASVSADGVQLVSAGSLRLGTVIADNGNIDVVAGGALSVNDAQAIGSIELTSTGAGLSVGRARAGYAPLAAAGIGAGVGNPGPGDITFNAAGNIQLSQTIDARGRLSATAGGRIDVGAFASGAQIVFRSSDVGIGATAVLGESNRTNAITLTDTGSGPMVLGDGFTVQGSYAVSNAEFGRIHSGGDLTFDAGSPAQTASPTRLVIGDLTGAASTGAGPADGQFGQTATLRLTTGGNALVAGNAVIGNAGGNTVALTASGDILLDAARGSLRLTEGTGRGGTLRLSGTNVIAATSSALSDVLATDDTREVTRRLGLNDGVSDGRTLLEAGTLDVSAGSRFYVQNTAAEAAFDDRRGIVADTLRIAGRGQPLDIAINGLVGGVAGLKVIPLTSIDGQYTLFSSINGCTISGFASCNPAQQGDEIRDVIEDIVNGMDRMVIPDGFARGTLIEINQIVPAGFEPLIDEPVTGTGNDDLQGDDERCPSDDKDCKRE